MEEFQGLGKKGQEELQKEMECFDSDLELLTGEFKEYFENIDAVLAHANHNQQISLKKRYRFYLTKLYKLEEVEQSLNKKYLNLDEIVENSAPIKQQKTSIAFIEMISTETLKKLSILGKKVSESKEIKKKNEKEIEDLKDLIKKEKSQFFNHKKDELQLLKKFENLKKENQLYLADCKFKAVVHHKNQEKKNSLIKNLRNTDINFRNKMNQMPKNNLKIRKPNNKNLLLRKSEADEEAKNTMKVTDIDRIQILKNTFISQMKISKTGEMKASQLKASSDQFHSKIGASTGGKWWINRKNQQVLAANNKENMQDFMRNTTNSSGFNRKISKKQCQGCQKNIQRQQYKSVDKFVLQPSNLVSISQKQNFCRRDEKEKLQFVDKNLLSKLQEEKKNKELFLSLSAKQIIQLISKKNKFQQFFKLIEMELLSKYGQKKKEVSWKSHMI